MKIEEGWSCATQFMNVMNWIWVSDEAAICPLLWTLLSGRTVTAEHKAWPIFGITKILNFLLYPSSQIIKQIKIYINKIQPWLQNQPKVNSWVLSLIRNVCYLCGDENV